jgi:hypothetical protein
VRASRWPVRVAQQVRVPLADDRRCDVGHGQVAQHRVDVWPQERLGVLPAARCEVTLGWGGPRDVTKQQRLGCFIGRNRLPDAPLDVGPLGVTAALSLRY